MSKRARNIFGLSALFLSTFIYLPLAFDGYKTRSVTTRDCVKLTGAIIQRGVEIRQPYKGEKPFYFYCILDRLPERELTFYQPSRRYDMLLYALNVGDTVTAFVLNEALQRSNAELKLVQLEKEGEVIIDHKLYQQEGNFLFWIGLLAGTGLVLLSVWGFAKMFRRRKKKRWSHLPHNH